MIVRVRTVGTLKNLEEGTKLLSLDVPDQTSVSQIMARLSLKEWEVGFILINGAQATKDSILKDQDQLTLIAPLVGG